MTVYVIFDTEGGVYLGRSDHPKSPRWTSAIRQARRFRSRVHALDYLLASIVVGVRGQEAWALTPGPFLARAYRIWPRPANALQALTQLGEDLE